MLFTSNQNQFIKYNSLYLIQVQPRLVEPILVVHGGAGDIPDSRDEGKHRGTKLAVRLGYNKLINGGSAIDAVEEAIRSMELDENFNAGV